MGVDRRMSWPEIAVLVVLAVVWLGGIAVDQTGWASLLFAVILFAAMAVFGWWGDLYPWGV